MGIEIREVKTKSDLKRFVKLPFKIYRDNPYWIPPLIKDELQTFSKKHNPSFGHCEAKLWLAYSNNEVVGRIAGIVHQDEALKEGVGRFGWLDFEDDVSISEKLFETVQNWLRERGVTGMHGPMGFTDMDFEGMLVEGFDEIGTIATIYNHSYYPVHLEKLGFEKAIDWFEFEGNVPDEMPYRLKRKSEIIQSRFKFKSLKLTSVKQMLKYGAAIFDVLNKSYVDLYGFYPLNKEQIANYTKQYLSFIKPEFSSVIVNAKEEVIGFGITMPSLSKAFQKARGSLFPFGFIHILRALKKNTVADLYLVGVLPEYQKMGVSLLIMRDIWEQMMNHGIRTVYSNPALENNNGVLNHWKEYEDLHRIRKIRRCYIKKID